MQWVRCGCRVRRGDESDEEEDVGAGRAQRDVGGADNAGAAPAAGASAPLVKPEPAAEVAPAMQAATLATSEALRGSAAPTPAAATPTPMETESSDPTKGSVQPGSSREAGAVAAGDGGAPKVTTVGAGSAVFPGSGGLQGEAAAGTVTLGASAGTGTEPPSGQAAGISILGPSANVLVTAQRGMLASHDPSLGYEQGRRRGAGGMAGLGCVEAMGRQLLLRDWSLCRIGCDAVDQMSSLWPNRLLMRRAVVVTCSSVTAQHHWRKHWRHCASGVGTACY